MTQTDYMLILASLVLGLALAELLQGVAAWLRPGGSTKIYWVHSCFVLNVFLFLLQFWWGMWSWREGGTWTLGSMVLWVAGIVALYLVAHLAFPADPEDSELRIYYYQYAPRLWGLGRALHAGANSHGPFCLADSVALGWSVRQAAGRCGHGRCFGYLRCTLGPENTRQHLFIWQFDDVGPIGRTLRIGVAGDSSPPNALPSGSSVVMV